MSPPIRRPEVAVAPLRTSWPSRRRALILAACALAMTACGDDSAPDPLAATATATTEADEGTAVPTGSPESSVSSPTQPPDAAPTATPATAPSPPPAPPEVAIPEDLDLQLTRLLEIDRPIDLAVRAGSPNLFLATKGGQVVEVAVDEADSTRATVVRQLVDVGALISDGAETGLLGLAFSPDGQRLYLSYSGVRGENNLVEYPMNGDEVAVDEARTLMVVDQPNANHNGGDIVFGPDGLLYVALGDGGGAGDPGGNGQDPDTLLGSILRIDPDGDPYAVPDDNPFADGGGRPEIFLYGVRNPWRISFDRLTGDFWVADVGQGSVEEIDVLYAATGGGLGANLGWNRVEGNLPFAASTPPDEAYVGPIYQYGREDGCSITGGYVYRGQAIPDLQGSYIFGDYCSGHVWGLASSEAQGLLGRFDLGLEVGSRGLVSFGEDAAGELYVLSFDNTLSRIDPA